MWVLTQWGEAINLAHAQMLRIKTTTLHNGTQARKRSVVVADPGGAIKEFDDPEKAAAFINELCSSMNARGVVSQFL